MNLLEATRHALDYTLRLDAALSLDDMGLCREILLLRGDAMVEFERAHRAASAADAAACRPDIQRLAEADRMLREKTEKGLESVAREFRQNLVSNRQGSSGGYEGASRQACIDRRA